MNSYLSKYMAFKNKNENDKNPDWQVPVTIKGANKGDYDASTLLPGGKHPEMLEDSKNAKMLSGTDGRVTSGMRELAKEKDVS